MARKSVVERKSVSEFEKWCSLGKVLRFRIRNLRTFRSADMFTMARKS
jgi:hypothetical protein